MMHFMFMHIYDSRVSQLTPKKEMETNEPIFKAMSVSSTFYIAVAKLHYQPTMYSLALCFPSVYRQFTSFAARESLLFLCSLVFRS